MFRSSKFLHALKFSIFFRKIRRRRFKFRLKFQYILFARFLDILIILDEKNSHDNACDDENLTLLAFIKTKIVRYLILN